MGKFVDEAEPRWLDHTEMDAWLPLARLMIQLPAALDAQLRRDAGISHFQYAVLARLSDAPDCTLRMSTLADFTNGSLSRLSHVVARLESQGWVTRRPSPEDGRYTEATLTKKGYAKVVASAPGHVEAVRRLVVDPLTRTQLRQLSAITARLADALADQA